MSDNSKDLARIEVLTDLMQHVQERWFKERVADDEAGAKLVYEWLLRDLLDTRDRLALASPKEN